ncbi:MAG: ASCH domain-containing protein [Dehalococcoidia bacterium]
MKGLSLTQPYASLVAIGAKRIETRSWRTDYRGWVAIHAAKGFPGWAVETTYGEPFRVALTSAGYTKASDLPRGAIVALARLQGCFGTPSEGSSKRVYPFADDLTLPPPEPERSFGDYSSGRFAWVFSTVRRLPEPIRYQGRLGLWDVPVDLEHLLFIAIGHVAPEAVP